MARNNLITGQPSAYTVDGDAIHNALTFGISHSSNIYQTLVDDIKHAMDGGEINQGAPTLTSTFLVGHASGDTDGQALEKFRPGEDPGQIVVTLPGKGSGTPQTLTVTAAHPRVESANGPSDSGGRSQVDVSVLLFSVDGSTAPYTLVWS